MMQLWPSRSWCLSIVFIGLCSITSWRMLSSHIIQNTHEGKLPLSKVRVSSHNSPVTRDRSAHLENTREGISLKACEIFCRGPLLKAEQNDTVFNDSKTFVDLHMKNSPDDVLAAFNKVKDPTDQEYMRNFTVTYFDGPGAEFMDWDPVDWKPRPNFLSRIKDDTLQIWATDLHHMWKQLGRKIKHDVSDHQDQYSLIYLDQPFIIPGGRFREFYYWDTYWIMKGLLISEMTQTVRGMLSNFAYMVNQLGFIPNGNRIYYTDRSQPPFFIPSVYNYLKATNDTDFVKSLLPTLEKEYIFWMTNRTVNVKKPGRERPYHLNRYAVFTDEPRPESFREDSEMCSNCSKEESTRFYSNLASGAETGWDFSSRWLKDNGKDLLSIRTKDIVPVDLNSILCLNEKILSELFYMDGQTSKAHTYMQAHLKRRRAIQDVFWVEKTGVWMDFDLEVSHNRDEFYPSNILPMWAKCYPEGVNKTQVEEKVLNYLKKLGVLEFPGGVPTSLKETGQQWDYPNAWPPLQEMVIQALASSDLSEARDYAFKLAQNWTTTNWKAYKEKGIMFEKYDVEKQGVPGHGGEYVIQVGFGWTNGVILTLLDIYGDKLTPDATRHMLLGTTEIIILSVAVAVAMSVCLISAIVCSRRHKQCCPCSSRTVLDVPYTPINTEDPD